jgi:hypothetical protein
MKRIIKSYKIIRRETKTGLPNLNHSIKLMYTTIFIEKESTTKHLSGTVQNQAIPSQQPRLSQNSRQQLPLQSQSAQHGHL